MQIISFTVKIIDFFYDEQNDVPHRDKDDIWLLIEENIICIESENDKKVKKYRCMISITNGDAFFRSFNIEHCQIQELR